MAYTGQSPKALFSKSNLLDSEYIPRSEFESNKIINPQTYTESEKGQALANIGASVLSGFRNKIINGEFSIGQRGASFSSAPIARYGLDRWYMIPIGTATMSMLRTLDTASEAFAGNSHQFFATIDLGNTSGAGNACVLQQKIEDVRNLSGRKATFTAYVASSVSSKISMEITQWFGVEGSKQVIVGHQEFDIGTGWTRCDFVVDIPSTLGKNLAAGHYLEANIWFSAGADYAARTGSLGVQTGTRYVGRVSLVEGDATAEYDPFSPRHIQQELALCQRYYNRLTFRETWSAQTASQHFSFGVGNISDSMRIPNPTISTVGAMELTNAGNFAANTASQIAWQSLAAGPVVVGGILAFDAEL